MYDEAVCIQIEYCINEYEPIDIPDYIINDLNEYIEKYGSELRVDTVEKVHNLVNSKEVAKAEEEERKAEAAAKAEEIQEAKAAKENNSKIDVKNKDMVVNSSNQTNMNNVSNSAKTFYNNGHPHTYKYEDKNCCIIAELSVKEDKKDSPIDIYIIRYDNGNDFETYSRDAVLNSVQDEKGNDRGVNGAYYRGWDIDSGTDIFVEFNYETEYCRIRMDVSPIENISGFDYVFDYEYVYYPEELDGVDDGILDIDDIDIDLERVFSDEENIGKTIRFHCSYDGTENGYLCFYFQNYSSTRIFYSKTDKDFGSFFEGDKLYVTATWKGGKYFEEYEEYMNIIDIIDLQRQENW